MTSNRTIYLEGSPYESKPRRCGAFVLVEISDAPFVGVGWIYTARPELYRQQPGDATSYPFFESPPHMRADDHV